MTPELVADTRARVARLRELDVAMPRGTVQVFYGNDGRLSPTTTAAEASLDAGFTRHFGQLAGQL